MIFHIINPMASPEINGLDDFEIHYQRMKSMATEYSRAINLIIGAMDMDDEITGPPCSMFELSGRAWPVLRAEEFTYLKSRVLNLLIMNCWKCLSRQLSSGQPLSRGRLESDISDHPITLGNSGVAVQYISSKVASLSFTTARKNRTTGKPSRIRLSLLLETPEQIQLIEAIISRRYKIEGAFISRDDSGLEIIDLRWRLNPKYRVITMPEVVTTITLPDETISGKLWTNDEISRLSAGVARGIRRQYQSMIGRDKRIEVDVRVLIDTSNLKRVPADLLAHEKLFKFKPEA